MVDQGVGLPPPIGGGGDDRPISRGLVVAAIVLVVVLAGAFLAVVTRRPTPASDAAASGSCEDHPTAPTTPGTVAVSSADRVEQAGGDAAQTRQVRVTAPRGSLRE